MKIHLTKDYIKEHDNLFFSLLIPSMLIFFGLLFTGTAMLMPFGNDFVFHITFALIFALYLCLILPGIADISNTLSMHKKIKSGKFEIRRYVVIKKDYDTPEEFDNEYDDEKDNELFVFLQDNNGDIITHTMDDECFIDAKIGDEYFKIIVEGFEDKEKYYEGSKYYI